MCGVKHWFSIFGFWWIKNRQVMCRHNGVHVTHATITYLNSLFIKHFVEEVRRGEMFM